MTDFPKMLYAADGTTVVARNAADEADHVKGGYSDDAGSFYAAQPGYRPDIVREVPQSGAVLTTTPLNAVPEDGVTLERPRRGRPPNALRNATEEA